MIYINENDINNIGIQWNEIVKQIEKAVHCLYKNDFAQPIKPYLRYRDLKNRIIAMPAFVGGEFNIAGIKWIASFPENIQKGIPRAHSVVVLNDADSGVPVCIINTALLSIVRTAGVSATMLKYFHEARPMENFVLGIIGWGPIGQNHFKMCMDLYGEKISKVYLYDLKGIDKESIDFYDKNKITVTDNWQEVYNNSNVFITCTVSKEPYINIEPKKGSLLLNVSLRDFKTDVFDYVKDSIIVDDWDEVCREKTDIEIMHKEKGLSKSDTASILQVVCEGCMKDYPASKPIMFNPMGMAIFDVAVGSYYFNNALKMNIGTKLV